MIYILKKNGWRRGDKWINPGDTVDLTKEEAEMYMADGVELEEAKDVKPEKPNAGK